jgi:hypothetical protein
MLYEGIQLYMDTIKMIVWTQGNAMLWLYGMLDKGIQFYMHIMWNETQGNAMQWLKGIHPVEILWHMNMMCNQLYIVTIWNETQWNAMLWLYGHQGMQCYDCMKCYMRALHVQSIIYSYHMEWNTMECNVMIVWTPGNAMLWLYEMLYEGIQ